VTSQDVLLSLGRWVSYVLLEPWTVTIGEARESSVDERPVAVVEPTAAVTRVGAALGPGRTNGRVMPVSVAAYPKRGRDAMRTLLEASEVADALEGAVFAGLFAEDDTLLSAAGQLPIWDYEGVDLDGPGPEVPSARMDVLGPSCRVVQDPEDARLASVQLTMSVRWWVQVGGRSRADVVAPVAVSVPGVFVPPVVDVP
jgi:hypothetical protein